MARRRDAHIAALQGGGITWNRWGRRPSGLPAPFMWDDITGGTSAFADHPTWVAGASTLKGARTRCIGSGFTGGGVALAQYPHNGFDANVRC